MFENIGNNIIENTKRTDGKIKRKAVLFSIFASFVLIKKADKKYYPLFKLI